MEINKSTVLNAPTSKVWQALTDHTQFGEWFRVKLNEPFKEGQLSQGHLTYPGYEHLKWESKTVAIQNEKYFSFSWHPYAIDPKIDYSQETPTLVEFFLEKMNNQTKLTVKETGFEKLPPHRISEAFQSNTGGWEEQLKNIEKYLS